MACDFILSIMISLRMCAVKNEHDEKFFQKKKNNLIYIVKYSQQQKIDTYAETYATC